MASDDLRHKLQKLSPRERQILALRCEGLEFKEIGHRIGLAESTVKIHMGNVYVKLEIKDLRRNVRRSLIDRVVCPALEAEMLSAPGVPQLPEPDPEPVPDDVMQMVEEDEQALVLYAKPGPPAPVTRPPIIIEPRSTQPPRRGRWLVAGIVFGVLLGMLVMVGLFFVFRGILGGTATPVAQASTPTLVVVTQPITIVVTATPVPVTPTNTPTETPSPTATVPPTDTATPTLSPNTPAGTILEIGQSWRQDDVLLTLTDRNFDFNWDPTFFPCSISFRFTLENLSSSNILVTVRLSEFSLTDNLSRSWKPVAVNTAEVCPGHDLSPLSDDVPPGETFHRPGYSHWYVGFQGNLTDPALDFVMITVTGLYHFDQAKWRIPIDN